MILLGFKTKIPVWTSVLESQAKISDLEQVEEAIQVCQVNKLITLAPSIPKRYKEILSDLKAQSYHKIVPPSLVIQNNRVVDGADSGHRKELQEHDAKDKGDIEKSCKL